MDELKTELKELGYSDAFLTCLDHKENIAQYEYIDDTTVSYSDESNVITSTNFEL